MTPMASRSSFIWIIIWVTSLKSSTSIERSCLVSKSLFGLHGLLWGHQMVRRLSFVSLFNPTLDRACSITLRNLVVVALICCILAWFKLLNLIAVSMEHGWIDQENSFWWTLLSAADSGLGAFNLLQKLVLHIWDDVENGQVTQVGMLLDSEVYRVQWLSLSYSGRFQFVEENQKWRLRAAHEHYTSINSTWRVLGHWKLPHTILLLESTTNMLHQNSDMHARLSRHDFEQELRFLTYFCRYRNLQCAVVGANARLVLHFVRGGCSFVEALPQFIESL